MEWLFCLPKKSGILVLFLYLKNYTGFIPVKDTNPALLSSFFFFLHWFRIKELTAGNEAVTSGDNEYTTHLFFLSTLSFLFFIFFDKKCVIFYRFIFAAKSCTMAWRNNSNTGDVFTNYYRFQLCLNSAILYRPPPYILNVSVVYGGLFWKDWLKKKSKLAFWQRRLPRAVCCCRGANNILRKPTTKV